MKKIIETAKKSSITSKIVAVLLVVAICVTSIWHGLADKTSKVKAAEGGSSDKAYLEYIIDRMIGGLQENFTIVEVVPHESMGEFRYYIGEDAVEEGLESNTTLMNWYFRSKGNAVEDIWYDMGSDFSNFGYSFRYNSETDKYEVESPMRFVNFVLPEYKEYFVDNIDLITVAGNDLTPEILEKADLLVLSTGTHDESTIDCYNSFTDPSVTDLNSAAAWEYNIWSGTVNADGTSTDMTRVTNKSNFTYNTFEQVTVDGTTKYVSRDISWEMVEKLWEYTIKGKKVSLSDGSEAILKVPVIMDNQGFQSLNTEGNMYKYQIVYRALTETQYDQLLPYISKVDSSSNSYINNENIITAELDIDKAFPADAELTWYVGSNTNVMETFYKIFGNPYDQNSGVSKDSYEDYQPPRADCLRDWYWVYNGNSCLIPSNKDTTYQTDSTGSEKGFGDRVGTSCTVIDVMRYLLGAKDAPVVNYNNPVLSNGKVKVLEIQPTAGTNVFKYDTYDEVKALAEKMLLAVDGKDADGNQMFDALTEDNYNDPNANTCIYIECISSSGFNGINDDIVADYDAIFLGDNDELLLKDSNGKPVYNDTALNGYIYLAFGDLIKCKTGISVYYPEDYTRISTTVNKNGYTLVNNTLWNDRGVVSPWTYPKLDADGNVVTDAGGNIVYEGISWRTRNGAYTKVYKLDTKLWNPLLYNSTSMTVGNYYVLTDATTEALNASSQSAMLSDNTGLVRLSGNDITQLKCNQLKEFVDSGKLLILGEELYNYTSSSKTVYPTSNMAEIAQYTIDNSGNRIKEERIGAMLLYLHNQNPKILNLTTPTPVEYDASGVVTKFNEAKVLADGTRLKATDLPFTFTLDGAVNTTYQLRVYGDKNNDGVYNKSGSATDDTNERYHDSTVTTDANGIADVRINVELPEEYNGLMSYRLEVTQLDASGNVLPYRAGITGYTAIKGAELKSIHVLQILPVPYRDRTVVDKSINLNMETDKAFNDLINDAESIIGYDIEVHAIYTEEYENWFDPSKGGMVYNADDSDTDRLYNYDMVVIGFGDLYCGDDISNDNGALDCLDDFIAKGKAVLFTHDTVGYSNTVNGMYVSSNTLNKHSTNTWATSLSRMFRATVGMDRYGITLAESMTASAFKNVPYDKNNNPVLYGLQGVTNMLAYRHAVATQAANDAVDFETSVPSRGKYLLYPYTTGSISDYTKLMETTKVTKLNDGQVTMYPYAISDSLTVAETHSQWYQLDMEDPEIVVWYTLAGDGNGTAEEYATYGYEDATAATKASVTLDQYYIDNDKDAGNNYYIFSKKNITYSGAGHSSMDSPEELKLFVNTVVKAITAGNSTPVVNVRESSLATDGFNNVYVTPYSGNYSFKFVGSDADLLPRVGLFKTAKITLTNVDTDGNGTVTEADHITWDLGNTLASDQLVTVEIKEGGTGKFDAYAAQISNLIDTVSGAQFEISITDMYNAEGRAKVKLVKRDLFNMD